MNFNLTEYNKTIFNININNNIVGNLSYDIHNNLVKVLISYKKEILYGYFKILDNVSKYNIKLNNNYYLTIIFNDEINLSNIKNNFLNASYIYSESVNDESNHNQIEKKDEVTINNEKSNDNNLINNELLNDVKEEISSKKEDIFKMIIKDLFEKNKLKVNEFSNLNLKNNIIETKSRLKFLINILETLENKL